MTKAFCVSRTSLFPHSDKMEAEIFNIVRYLESEFLDDTRSGYGLRGSGAVTSSVGGYITNGPSHDRFGRELSNYDRWRMQNGESLVTARDDDPVRYAKVLSSLSFRLIFALIWSTRKKSLEMQGSRREFTTCLAL